MTSPNATLGQLEMLHRDLVKQNRQASYGRRAPSSESKAGFSKLRSHLKDLIKAYPGSERALRILANAEEALLNYRDAANALREAIRLSKRREHRDLKKLAFLEKSAAEWEALILSPEDLKTLGEFVFQMLGNGPCDLRWTETWVEERFPDRADQILAAIKAHGGHTDVQVLHNVVRVLQ